MCSLKQLAAMSEGLCCLGFGLKRAGQVSFGCCTRPQCRCGNQCLVRTCMHLVARSGRLPPPPNSSRTAGPFNQRPRAMPRPAWALACALVLLGAGCARAEGPSNFTSAAMAEGYAAAVAAAGKPHLAYDILPTERPLLDSMAQLGRSGGQGRAEGGRAGHCRRRLPPAGCRLHCAPLTLPLACMARPRPRRRNWWSSNFSVLEGMRLETMDGGGLEPGVVNLTMIYKPLANVTSEQASTGPGPAAAAAATLLGGAGRHACGGAAAWRGGAGDGAAGSAAARPRASRTLPPCRHAHSPTHPIPCRWLGSSTTLPTST